MTIVPILFSFVQRGILKNQTVVGLMENMLDEGARVKLFLDCGSFTQYTKGKKIDIHEYTDWVAESEEVTSGLGIECEYASLDVIGDQKASCKNYDRMVAMGFEDCIPIFTKGGDVEILNEYLVNCDRVAVGGLVSDKANAAAFLKDLYFNNELVREHHRKLHLFGFTQVDLVALYKPGSVDSSGNILRAKKFKTLTYYEAGNLVHIRKEDMFKSSRNRNALRYFCERYKFSYDDLCLEESEWINRRGAILGEISAFSNMLSIQKLYRRLGVTYYTVVSNSIDIEDMLMSVRKIEEVKNA